MGRAIVRNPQAFLMDEPRSNLDAKLRVQMRAELGQLHTQLQTTTLYVTHDQVEAMTMGDRVAVIRKGELQQIDTPREIYLNPRNIFVAGFIGSPSMNLIDGVVSDGVFQSTNTSISGLKINDGPITLGFRAEDATVSKKKSEIGENVYTQELLGDATMITVKVGNALVSVKADKNFRASIGEKINISVPAGICHLFDTQTGARIEG